jgi:hypothetical protein
MALSRFLLVREGFNNPRLFPVVTIRDRSETVPVIINGFPSREYKRASGPMPYLDAVPLMREMEAREAESSAAFDRQALDMLLAQAAGTGVGTCKANS